MAEEKGIKETKEAAVAVLKIAGVVADVLKDGAQLKDFETVYQKLTQDEAFKAAVKAGYEGIGEVSAELKDLSILEGVELVSALTPDVLEVVGKLK